MRIKKYMLFLCGFLLLFSCRKEVEEERKLMPLEAYNQVHLIDAFEVYLIEGDTYSVEIVGDKDVIDQVKFTVRNSLLSIENDRKAKWRTPTQNEMKIYLTAKAFRELTAEGGSIIQTLNPITKNEFGLILTGKANEANLEIRSEGFYYWNNFPSGGKLTLTGEVNTLKLWNYALMAVDAKNLVTGYALVENNSKGDCIVNVKDRLDYKITGEGNIGLYGNPTEINLDEKSSSGELILY